MRSFFALMSLLLPTLVVGPVAVRAEPFTVAIIPDTQFYSRSFPLTFIRQTEWLVQQRNALNIAMVTHVGDLVHNGGSGTTGNLTEWQNADAAMDILVGDPATRPNGYFPYSAVPGNHDYTIPDNNSGVAPAARYVEFFGPARYQGRAWYGGSSPNGLNHYQYFRGGGYHFLHLGLEWEVPNAALAWAQGILDEHPNMPTIISTHSNLRQTGGRRTTPQSPAGNSAEDIFRRLVAPNPQIFMVLNGHDSGTGAYQSSLNERGLPVIEIANDFQAMQNGGDGWLRLLRFDPDANEITVQTYSPTRNGGQGEYAVGMLHGTHIPLDFEYRLRAAIAPEPSSLFLAAIFAATAAARIVRKSLRRRASAHI
jgi:hypothetical protein